jgi:CubicO group peptidase (beta-lactamase class C family)
MLQPLRNRLRANRRRTITAVGLPLVVGLAILSNLPSQERGTVVTAPASDSEIEAFVASEVSDAGIPGAALAIIRDGEVSAVKGFGVADSNGRDVTPQTPFSIGSLTKSVTALAILQLADAGGLELDVPAQRYVPEFSLRDSQAAAAITVRQLLNQTSGIPTSAGETPLGEPATSLDARVLELADVTPVTAPGASYAYSNANYEVLGLIVERVSGELFPSYVDRHILRPLSMTHSHTNFGGAEADGLTRAHRLWFGLPDDRTPLWRSDLQPAGFLAASAEDLGHLVAAELNGGVYNGVRVASAQAIAESQHGTSPMGIAEAGRYGFGWADLNVGGLRIVGHVGSTTDMASVVFFAPEQHLGMVLLLNGQSTLYELVHKPDFIGTAIIQKLAGREPAGTLQFLYPAVDAISLALIGFAAWRLAVVAVRLRRGTPNRVRAFGKPSLGIVLSIFLYGIVPAEILLNVPRFLAAPWTTLVRIDIGLVLFTFAMLRLATGILILGPHASRWARRSAASILRREPNAAFV